MAKGKKAKAADKAENPSATKKAVTTKAAAGKSTVAAKAKKAAPAPKSADGKSAVAAKAKKTSVPVKGKGKAAKKPASLPHLDDKMLRQIIAKLDGLREDSMRVVNMHMHEDMKQREESVDVGDDMDQASSERDREFSLIIHQRHLRRLKQVDEAFERIEDGTYGLCEGTEEPIDSKRLLIMPLARFSIEYQQQQEKMLGRSPDDGLGMSDETMITDE